MRQRITENPSRTARTFALAASAAAVLALAAPGNALAATEPDLAVDPSGNASFAWVRADGAFNNLIQERRRSAGGVFSDTEFISAVGQDAADPEVAVASDGTASFVWVRFNGTDFIAQARSRAPDGTLSPVQNLSAAGQSAVDPQVAVDQSGRATFVWRRFNGSNEIIQTRRRLANGTLDATQSISGSGQDALDPQVAVHPNGNATFVWKRFDGASHIVQTRRRLANGTFGGVQNLSAPGQNASNPQVAVDPDDRASFVWTRFDGTNGIAQARRRLSNGPLEATQDLSAPGLSASNPQVAVDLDGRASFVWHRLGGTFFVVQARRRLANGTLEATQGISAAGQDAVFPQVAVAPGGAASFVWERFNGANIIAQTRRRLASGTFGSTQNLSPPGADAFDVRVGVDQSDNATFAWQRAGVIQTRRRTTSLGATVDLSN